MPPDQRPIPRFAAEPPHDSFPYGRWAEQLGQLFLEACDRIEADEDIGHAQHILWFPDRTFQGRTYIPATAPTDKGFELFGYVSFDRSGDGDPTELAARADYTDETAEQNPDWQLDLSEEEIGAWTGERNLRGSVALVWGVALMGGGALATAELGPTTTDQCALVEQRFTLVSLDSWTGDMLEVRLWDAKGGELARESLYEED
jgi:hypothetical protein